MSITKELVAKLLKVGIEQSLIKEVDNTLSVDLLNDFLKLPAEVQNQAFLAATSNLQRPLMEFVKMLVEELGEVSERFVERAASARGPVNGPRERPGGPKGVWGGVRPRNPVSPPTRGLNIPRTAEQHYDYLQDFLSKNYGPLQFDKEEMTKRAAEAQKVALAFQRNYKITPEEAATLTKLSFYDIFILCDNSSSMRKGKRIEILCKTLHSIVVWAIMVEKNGLSLRFLNKVEDGTGNFDYLKSEIEVDDRMTTVPISGSTKLGTTLRNKVVKPLVKRLSEAKATGERVKPRVVVIITDGQPTSEDKDCLRNTILEAKEELEQFGNAATLFIITRIGDDEDAIEYLEDLAADEEINSVLLTVNSNLEDVVKKMGDEQGKNGYQVYLMRNLFIAALDSQTV